MTFEKKFRVENPYGVTIFEFFSSRNIPHHPKNMGEKKFQYQHVGRETQHAVHQQVITSLRYYY